MIKHQKLGVDDAHEWRGGEEEVPGRVWELEWSEKEKGVSVYT